MPVSSDRQERERVRSRIGSLIMEFCGQVDTFHMEDLNRFVKRYAGFPVAPDSPGRILRELRRYGFVRVELISRRGSLYRVIRGMPAEQMPMFQARAS